MEKIVITPEILMNADDALPLIERQTLLESIAQDCIVKVTMSYIPTGGSEPQPMPDRYQEYRVNTCLYLMGVLAAKYLHIPVDGMDESLKMPVEEYDRWNASHVLSQIEEFKSDKVLRDKAFNLMSDYRDFRNALYREIETMLGHHNDLVWRFMDAFSTAVMSRVSDAVDEAANEITGANLTDEEREAKRQEAVKAVTEALEQLQTMKEGLSDATTKMRALKGGEESDG